MEYPDNSSVQENLSGAFDQEEWEYFNLRTGEEEMTQAERDAELNEWRKLYDAETLKEREKIKTTTKDWTHSSEYADYIMNNCAGDRIICNGDTLVDAMEDGYLYDEFLQSIGEVEC